MGNKKGAKHMQFLSYLVNGISLGSIYAVIALGYTMVYGIARMLNSRMETSSWWAATLLL